jgi:phage FluMu protein Com
LINFISEPVICAMPQSTLLLGSCDSLSFVYVSATQPTCFTAPCPYCAAEIKVDFGPTLFGPTGGCTNTNVPVHFLISSCPFCEISITMTAKPNEGNRLFLELLQPSPEYRLRLAAPEGDAQQSRLPSQPSLAEQPDDAPQFNTYLEIIKQRGYLSAEECYSDRGQRWNGNLYWERRCPQCGRATQIRLTPLPPSVNRGKLDEMTDPERRAIETFCRDLCRRPIEDFVKCPYCKTLLAITLSFTEPSGGLYMSQWSVASSDPDQEHQLLSKRPKPLEFGRSHVFFNQFATAQVTKSGVTVWSLPFE